MKLKNETKVRRMFRFDITIIIFSYKTPTAKRRLLQIISNYVRSLPISSISYCILSLQDFCVVSENLHSTYLFVHLLSILLAKCLSISIFAAFFMYITSESFFVLYPFYSFLCPSPLCPTIFSLYTSLCSFCIN